MELSDISSEEWSPLGASKMALRILIVDDHEPTRRAIASLLAARLDWHVCGEASDGINAIARAKELRPRRLDGYFDAQDGWFTGRARSSAASSYHENCYRYSE